MIQLAPLQERVKQKEQRELNYDVEPLGNVFH